jgi:late competence protein required for DNA uptake (superfamily II DNA/RNA helicase)
MLNFIGKNAIKPNTYICQGCHQSKHLNESNFEIVKNFKYGFTTYCRECIGIMNVQKERKT